MWYDLLLKNQIVFVKVDNINVLNFSFGVIKFPDFLEVELNVLFNTAFFNHIYY